jgi:hypothetical protein
MLEVQTSQNQQFQIINQQSAIGCLCSSLTMVDWGLLIDDC